VRRELTIMAKRKGNKPPRLHEIVKGSVRRGIHATYGEDYISGDILDRTDYRELVPNDSSQFDEDEDRYEP